MERLSGLKPLSAMGYFEECKPDSNETFIKHALVSFGVGCFHRFSEYNVYSWTGKYSWDIVDSGVWQLWTLLVNPIRPEGVGNIAPLAFERLSSKNYLSQWSITFWQFLICIYFDFKLKKIVICTLTGVATSDAFD